MAIDENTGGPSSTAPAAQGTLSSDQIAPGTRVEQRNLIIRPGQSLSVPEKDLVPGSAVEYETPNVAGGKTRAGVAPSPTSAIARVGYMGTKLVDRNGVPARGQYDPSKEAYSFLSGMQPPERIDFLNALHSRGVISKNDVTGRFTAGNINGTAEFLMYANYRGATGDVALGLFLADPNIPATGGGGRIRTTPKEDLRAVFRETTRKYLGREVSATEIEKFVNSYTRREISEARGGETAPSAATAAEVMVQQQFGEEAQAMRAVNFANIIEQKIKGLA
jgi:hypothetical protein